MQKSTKYLKLREYITKNSHHVSAIVFIFGFFFDAFTLPDVTYSYSYLIGLTYAIIVGLLIYSREYARSDKLNFKNEDKYISISSIATSFFMGSLMGFVFIYYLRGADLISGLPILILLLVVMMANEFARFREKYILDIVVYSVSVMFLSIFMIPILLKRMTDNIFVISVLVATTFIYFYSKSVYSMNVKLFRFKIYNYILVVPILIVSMYFTNLMPAVPLTLRSGEIYGSITKSQSGEYVLDNRCRLTFNIYLRCGIDSSTLKDSRIFYYTEIQAPTDLNAKVTHKWEYYDKNYDRWILKANISYNISGGRKDGYRGYTTITNAIAGLYKVSVIINDKRDLGSEKFYVK